MGDESGLNGVWPRLEPRVRQICHHFFGGFPEMAEDALGTVYLRAWDCWDRVRRARDPEAYLARVAWNVCHDLRRRETRYARAVPWHTLDGVVDPEPVVDAIDRRLAYQSIVAATDQLPPMEREALVSNVLHRESQASIAQRLGVSYQTVRRCRQAALQRLRYVLAGKASDVGGGSEHHTEDTDDGGSSPEPEQPGSRPPRPRRQRSLDELLEDISARIADTRVVRIPLPSGGVFEYHAVFGDSLRRRGQRILTLKSYVDRHPSGWRKRLELANLLFADGQVAEAEVQFRAVLERKPGCLQAAIALGQILCLGQRAAEAAVVYEAVLPYVQTAAKRHHVVGLLHRARRDFSAAANEFRKAIELEPQSLEHYHELAATYDTEGRPYEAAEAYDMALAVDPDDVYALARSHNALTALGRYDIVLSRLERALQLDPNYTYAAKLLADRRAMMGLVRGKEGRRTLGILKRAIERDPDSADVWDAVSRYYDVRGDLEHSVAIWQHFLSGHPDSARGWMFLGTAYGRLQKWTEAAEAYRKAHALNPFMFDIHWRGTHILLRAGYRDEARRWAEEILERFSTYWDGPHVAAANLLRLGEDPEKCVALSRLCVERHPMACHAWANYGAMLLDVGRAEEAIRAFERAHELIAYPMAPARPGIIGFLGRALRALGREDEALVRFREMLELGESLKSVDPFYKRTVGQALMELGDFKGARAALMAAKRAGCWHVDSDLEELEERVKAAAVSSAQSET